MILLHIISINNITQSLKYEGTLNPDLILHPAQCNKATAGYMVPVVNFASLYATPIYYPFNEKAKTPVFMFKKTPRMPYFLNFFP